MNLPLQLSGTGRRSSSACNEQGSFVHVRIWAILSCISLSRSVAVHGTTQQRFLPFLLLAATAIPVSGTTYCGDFDQAVENAELSNIFAHSTSIPIHGFLCQPGVHFCLWPTSPSAKTDVSGVILLSTMHSLRPFLVPRQQSPLYLLSVSHIRAIDPRTTLVLAAILFS